MKEKNQESASFDPYSRVDYRRLIAWPQRIRREAPFIRKVLSQIPERSVIDLGCGSGEHSRFLADEGFRVVGLDRSQAMIEKATSEPLPPRLKFVLADLCEASSLVSGRFGAAISLGNTLVHLKSDHDLRIALGSVRELLRPDGVFLFQILNYERIFEKGIRYLPLNFRADDHTETIFLRLMELLEGGRVRFCPTTLKYDGASDPPLEVVHSRQVELRGWRRGELLKLLQENGFSEPTVYGGMQEEPYHALESQDLVVVARRTGST